MNWIRRTVGAFLALVRANNNWWIPAALVVAAIFGGFWWLFGWMAGLSAGDPSLEGVTPYLREYRLIMHPEMAPTWGHNGFVWISWLCKVFSLGVVVIAVFLIPVVIRDEIGSVLKAAGQVFKSRKQQGGPSPAARGSDTGNAPTSTAEVLEASNAFRGKGPWIALILTLLAYTADEIGERWRARRARKMAEKIVGGR